MAHQKKNSQSITIWRVKDLRKYPGGK